MKIRPYTNLMHFKEKTHLIIEVHSSTVVLYVTVNVIVGRCLTVCRRSVTMKSGQHIKCLTNQTGTLYGRHYKSVVADNRGPIAICFKHKTALMTRFTSFI